MIVTIQPGEILTIRVADEQGDPLDGEFQVHMDTKQHPRALVILKSAGIKANDVGEALAVLYRENYKPDFTWTLKVPAF